MSVSKDFYQNLYDDADYCYGEDSPGVKHFEHYQQYIRGFRVLDIGCGDGATIKLIKKEKFPVKTAGIDWIEPKSKDCVQGNILEQGIIDFLVAGASTLLLIDVLSHLPEEYLDLFIERIKLKRIRTIIGVQELGEKVNGVELHATKRPLVWWDHFIFPRFEVQEAFKVPGDQKTKFYICY